ncbi:MAG: GSCFA family protein [Rhodobacterales bacterium]|nr:MAG: GSCFA family protein [Rhodobacterales bacterium]
MSSPYQNLPAKAYWRSGVVKRGAIEASDLYTPKFAITRQHRIVTAGSCFAQHVGRTLKQAGYNVQDAEPGPNAPPKLQNRFGYGLYSARYGNVYTARQMRQLLREAFEGFQPQEVVWEKDGRFYDALRPSVEPEGLPTAQDVLDHRAQHLQAVRRLFGDLDLFVFTFGLTEAWCSQQGDTVYPTAPGTIAGQYQPERYQFRNFRYDEVLADFRAVRHIIRQQNRKARFLVTVSPVPLTATATGQHVEVASTYSKSVLRAVCGVLAQDFEDVDYFPSYEVITSQTAHGKHFEANYRSVRREGVAKAMALFMAAHDTALPDDPPAPAQPVRPDDAPPEDEFVCEEALLDAFAK